MKPSLVISNNGNYVNRLSQERPTRNQNRVLRIAAYKELSSPEILWDFNWDFFFSLNRIWNYQLSHLVNQWFCGSTTVFLVYAAVSEFPFFSPIWIVSFLHQQKINPLRSNYKCFTESCPLNPANVVWLTEKKSKCQTGRKTAICSANCRSACTNNKF